MKRFAVLCAVVMASASFAGELKGVKMPDSVTVAGKELKLNGLGLRRKLVFNVYVGGLYLENKSSDPSAILSADAVRRVDMMMMRNLDKGAIVDAIKNGVAKNSPSQVEALKERLEKFAAVIPDLKEGQQLTIVYVPGKGTHVEGSGVAEFNAPGKDFADAIFQVWLGKAPVDEDLKSGMLGK